MQKNCARKKCRNTQRGQEHCAKSKSALTITAPTLPSLRLDRKGRRKGVYKKISKYEKTRGIENFMKLYFLKSRAQVLIFFYDFD